MAENTALQDAIEDLKLMANKQTQPLQRTAFNMAITICEQRLTKEQHPVEEDFNPEKDDCFIKEAKKGRAPF